jgi:hypothetical protein
VTAATTSNAGVCDIVGWLLPILYLFIGAFLTGWGVRSTRRKEFVEKQVATLYSPLLAQWQRLCTLGRSRADITNSTSSSAQSAIAREQSPEAQAGISNELRPQVEANIQYNNDMTSEIIAMYVHMEELVRESLYLLEPEDRELYSELVRHNDLWVRHQAGALPAVAGKQFTPDDRVLDSPMGQVKVTYDKLRKRLR